MHRDEEVSANQGSGWASCPYCAESIEILVDPGGGVVQEYVEDCEVCCRPWSVRVTWDDAGTPVIRLSTLDGTG